jgi:cytochrome b pre-mRNA-processing protein 3
MELTGSQLAFKLPPTFSTWSHVTMLHLYLLNARVRCFERDTYQRWQQQLVDQFFFDAEKKMHVEHGITSSALRQRYLKDIFVQWRGLLLAYDEGLAKGDAILASAVWRNLFKGDPEVDPRALATVVGWMRASLKALETTSDFTFPTRAKEILEVPVEGIWKNLQTSIGPPVEAAKDKRPAEPQARVQAKTRAAAAAKASL